MKQVSKKFDTKLIIAKSKMLSSFVWIIRKKIENIDFIVEKRFCPDYIEKIDA